MIFWPFLYENLVVKKDSAGDNTGMMGIFDDVVSFTIPTFTVISEALYGPKD